MIYYKSMENTNQKQKIAIMYDFDDTLSIDCMENFGLFQYLGVEATEFFKEADENAAKLNMDKVLAFMFTLVQKAKEKNKPLTKELLMKFGKDIEYFPGVLTWFDRINKFGLDHGFVVEHYIISSGLNEIVEGCLLKDKFKKIYACEYVYDDNGNAVFPARAINYTNKTQFIFRINKGILDVSDDSINDFMEKNLRPLVYENMIYIGDGFTDVPCMKL
ncbi:MAG: haloacid dehalogenase-like hydrolase, partial [Clostridia bacterium]|nr:haloacid dehalogenase-like hydrolase [Clostridia bacterium]